MSQSSESGRFVEPLERRVFLSAGLLPRPDHVVVVVEEDHSYSQILGTQSQLPLMPAVPLNLVNSAPYIRQLAAHGASLTQMHSVGHPNHVTYSALFGGLNTAGLSQPYNAPNIGSELNAAGLSFTGYAESLPYAGYTGGDVGNYKHDHAPWNLFANIPASQNLPFSQFPTDYSKLPTVSFVTPNLQDNMHSGFISTADQWLHDNIGGYANWAMSHNSLLIVTWDESHEAGNQIPTIFYGPMVETGSYAQRVNQFNLLRTLEDMYGLPPTGQAAQANAMTGLFGRGGLSEASEDAILRARPHPKGGHSSIAGKVISATSGKGLSGWWVYLDTNNDGTLEPGEPVVHTDSRGRYQFSNLLPGAYSVRVVPQSAFTQTSPQAGVQFVTLVSHQHMRGILFSEQLIAGASLM